MKGRVLYAILDWGLGHATRSIPIINLLLSEGYEVDLASSGDSLKLLRAEFRDLSIHELSSYDPEYQTGSGLAGKILLQLPKFLKAISTEHSEVKELHTRNHYSLIISDNRYGAYIEELPSILICHQLTIPIDGKFGLLSPFIQSWHRRLMKPFDKIWVPDISGSSSLGGKMTVYTGEFDIDYIGWLSRLEKTHDAERGEEILFLISGPEPQRSLFEKELLEQAILHPQMTFNLVRGTSKELQEPPTNVYAIGLANSEQIQSLILSAKLIVCRSGYSSLMDLISLNKAAVLVPTPEMPEQQYLAMNTAPKLGFKVARQGSIQLSEFLDKEIELESVSNGFNSEAILKSLRELTSAQTSALS